MNRNLQRWFLILLTGFILLSTRQVEASHAMGADLTYQCLGGNTYRVRLSFYRDCIGIGAPANVYVNIRSASCGQNIGVTCNPVPGTGQEVFYLCPTAQTTCSGGTFTGIQEYVYEGVVTLPMQCTDWVFSYTLCCRNAAITTINNPGSATFYIYATLNNTISPCNSSPSFSNKPVPFACLGQQFCFNHGAIDADGDSLVYTLVDPKQTATTNVNYINPYTATNPLNSNPAVAFNNQTGDICFTPQQLQVTVMAVLVTEYRNGVKIGSAVRDIQVTVLNCNNNLPTLSGINGTNDFSTEVCAGEQLCFDIFSDDTDNGQQVSLMWNNGIPDATFTSAGSPHPTGNFCWTPSESDISNTPYCFTVRVNDDACPFLGSQTYSYCVTVRGVQVDAGPDQYIACNDLATVSAVATNGTGPYTYLWSNGFTNPTQTVPVGTYIVTVSDGQCSGTDTVNVISAFEPDAAFAWTGTCTGTAIQFNDQSITPGGISTWTWNFGDGNTSGLQHPVHTYGSPGTYNVSLTVENIYGCIDTIIHPVVVAPLPVPSFTIGTACAGSGITFTNTSNPPGTAWWWSFSDGQTSTSQNPSITFGTAGNYTATLIVQDSLGCRDTISQPFVVNPLPVASFSTSGSVCENSPVTFTDNSTGNPVSWNWNFGDGTTSTLVNPVHTFPGSGTFNVTLVVTNNFGCTDTLVQPVTINALPVADAGANQTICIGQSVTLTASGGTTYSWTPGGQTTGSITVSPNTNTVYTVVVSDAAGCSAIDSVLVTVNPLPVPVVSPDQVICDGQSVTLTASGGSTYYWNPGGNTSGSITVSPSASTTFAVDVTGANGCIATAFVNVTVNPVPVITLQTPIFICAGVSVTLDAGPGGTTYLWSNGATSQTTSVNTQGNYTVTVTNNFGCSTVASTQVTVGGQVVNNNNAISICQGQTAILDAGYPGSTYLWSNGSTAQTINANSPGVYQVTVTDPNGCSGTVAHTLMVNQVPVANFTPNDVCIDAPVNFQDISTVNGDTITAWSWDFGDGNISYQENPNHTYTSSGGFAITLTVTTASGCAGTATDSVYVYPLPQANFNYNHGCEGEPLQFTDQSSTAMGNITGWSWDFDDGTTSTQQHPTHYFTTSGTHQVSLTITTVGGCSATRTHNVQIFPQPDLSFTTTPTIGCAGSTMVVTNTSTTTNGAINNWYWDFGDGSTSTQSNPSHLYTTGGNFTVQLIGITSHGCSDTISQVVSVTSLPVADAGANVSICAGNSVNLTASGGGTYSWSPGGMTSATINVTPSATTTYTVVVTNASGCTSRDSVRVTVLTLPVASAGIDKSICAGSSTTLTAMGGGTYSWTPGGATTATINVSPAVTTPYIVTVTGANGCQRRDTAVITVNPLPVALAGPDQTICAGTTATLTASGGSTYLWQHNGSTNATVYVNPTVATNYIVTAITAAGCTAKDTVRVSLNPTPVVSLNNVFFCTGMSAVLNAGNPGATYEWSPNGETTQSITVSDPGVYSVIVTNAFGCQGSATATASEGGTGLSGTPAVVLACQGADVTLDAGNPGMTYLWSTGSTAQTINVNSTGSYTVTVSDLTGCTTTFINDVTVNPNPNASFTGTDVCLGSATAFTDHTTISQGNLALWEWQFSNGYSSTLQNPTQLFSDPGTYAVTLIVTSGAGCSDTIISSVNVNEPPLADIVTANVCHNTPVSFTDNSSTSGGPLSAWTWQFGDGATSSNQNPQHNYANPGTYNVSLISSTTAGCRDTAYTSVTVHPNPMAQFAVSDICDGDTVRFYNTSYINNGNLSDYSWNFGDGNTSSDENPVHVYSLAGTYTVTLTTGSDQACLAQATRQVRIHERPIAAFTSSPVCAGTNAIFVNQSTIGTGAVTAWYWNFGDGSSNPSQNPGHIYNNPGTYTVNMYAISDKGCRDTATSQMLIYNIPVADFSNPSVCLGSPVDFTSLSSVANDNLTGWNWNFGDGNTNNIEDPSHTYTSAGTFTVQLIATSAHGCKDTIARSVNVFPVPAADFFSGDVCVSDATEFYDQSLVSGGGSFTYNWNFDDNSTDTIANPVHAYALPGTYNVTLSVTTAHGCSASIMKPVQIYALPEPEFTADDVCLSFPTIFEDGSTVPGGVVNAWNWQFGDNTISSAQNPTHQYAYPGSFMVSLEVVSSHGCRSGTGDSVQIFNPPTPDPVATRGCVNEDISFTDTSSGANNNIISWEWDFGSGNSSTAANPVFNFNTYGVQSVILTTTNNNGCRGSAIVNIMVDPLPVAGFTNGVACAGSPVQFTNTSGIATGSISGYSWDFGDGTPSVSTTNPGHIFTQPGTYYVTLVAYSNEGCTDTVMHPVIINPLPVPSFVQVNASGCGPVTVQFTDSSYIATGNIVSWVWDFGDGSSSTQQNPSHSYVTSGTYSVSLTVTSNMGCQETVVRNNIVTVFPGPVAEFEPEPDTQGILNPDFNFINLTSGGQSYTWTFGDGGTSTAYEPSHSYSDTGTYMVTLYVVNSFGCRDTVQHPVRVEPEFHFWVPNAFTPNDDGVNDAFNVTGISIVDIELTIFNRWGDRIYYCQGRNSRGWDGTVLGKNQLAHEGVYVYLVEVKDVWGKIHQKEGHVFLVR